MLSPAEVETKEYAALQTALHLSYGGEIAKLKMQLVKYREALVENGIEPPDLEGEDLMQMWLSCRNVIKAAHDCVAQLGTSKELLWPMRNGKK